MLFSTFEIFKIGIGPSSSHTIGPMVAASRFLNLIRQRCGGWPRGIRVSLHGSLAFTGRGHSTDRATILGLDGFDPGNFDVLLADAAIARIRQTGQVSPSGMPAFEFSPEDDLVFDYERQLPGHANGMIFYALDADGDVALQETYYSVGGGTVVTEYELAAGSWGETQLDIPYPFATAAELLEQAGQHRDGIPGVVRDNEMVARSATEIDIGMDSIWSAMNSCIDRGLGTFGTLPGGLNVRRRAASIHQELLSQQGQNLAAPHVINDWISVYAMAVNEENAGGGQIVTAPTNGAAGVIPATLRYYLGHVPGSQQSRIADFLLVAAAIGGIIKQNASISGAECGCQAEVGSAAAMAAAGLCTVLGGTPQQVENAAEIALEHHLGMTCDPVGGLVQVPCIERNGLGAIKAVSSASLALRGDGTHFISLDSCIDTMRRTGADMSVKYKETSLGGLAVSAPNC